uniref:Large ribosomal subunit protein uL18m n=1 Tax=Culicoides sonorensis TaxID=179676 RepID=A0A336KSE6_CULSO
MQRFPNTRKIVAKLNEIVKKDAFESYLYNRNPKNLEKLNIAYNHAGFYLEKPGKTYYNKLSIETTGKYVTAKVIHRHDGPIIETSTKEWALKRQLCKTSNVSAYINLAKIFSDRCLKSGIYELRCDTNQDNKKIGSFLSMLEENGILLISNFKKFNPHQPNY